MQDFNNLITRMLFPENEARKEAEKQYDQIDLIPKTHLLFQLFMDQNARIEVWLSEFFLWKTKNFCHAFDIFKKSCVLHLFFWLMSTSS